MGTYMDFLTYHVTFCYSAGIFFFRGKVLFISVVSRMRFQWATMLGASQGCRLCWRGIYLLGFHFDTTSLFDSSCLTFHLYRKLSLLSGCKMRLSPTLEQFRANEEMHLPSIIPDLIHDIIPCVYSPTLPQSCTYSLLLDVESKLATGSNYQKTTLLGTTDGFWFLRVTIPSLLACEHDSQVELRATVQRTRCVVLSCPCLCRTGVPQQHVLTQPSESGPVGHCHPMVRFRVQGSQ